MKTFYKYSVLACAVLLAACQPKSEPKQSQDKPQDPPAVQQQAEPVLQGETVKIPVKLPECKGNTCPDFTVERLQSNFPFIDQLLDQQILEQLGKMLEVVDADTPAASTAKSTGAKSDLDSQAQLYADSFVKIDEELKALSSSHQISLMIKPKILQPKGKLATVVLNSSSYLGGAHGATSQRYYNFDLANQKQVQLQDLLLPKQKATLDKLAHDAFKTWIVDSKLATDPKEYEQAWPFQVTDNFLLGEQGLILQYGEYDIGPYVVGLPRLVIPFSELQGVLKPEYLPKVDTPAASTPVANENK
ncbi:MULTISPECIES: RsiV family protein [Acinetobacter]|uniref:RsiV family protein n=1 Tax=Acinetobacter TaxID=469 RepID=UPI00192B5E5A|nr:MULTISPECIES: RsiV family protein [Acinetobacter]MCU4369617.1 RsiV family protein [Acinetobacter courvalinii]MCU4447822.1 RsiV family protein [Acinetobacter courvalinii]